jgi:hypothetical protein
MNNDWLPIDTAPKDRRILLGYAEPVFNGIYCIIGAWEFDKFAKNPRPYFTHDLYRLRGIVETRCQQPIAWQELPTKPEK